jgi:hypothetical protein
MSDGDGWLEHDENIAFTFAVSTLASVIVTPPVRNTLHSPLVLLNPKSNKDKSGPPVGALGGKRGLVL